MQRNTLIVGAALLTLVLALLGLAQQSESPNSPEVEKQLNEVRADLKQVKGEMPALNCCIGPACNFCPLAAGKCPCGHNVKTEAGVCGECFLGWKAGQGEIQGVEPGEVQMIEGKMVDMMYKMQEKHFGQ